MSVIIDKMMQEIINRSNLFEEKTKGTKDEYNIYKEHIKYVYNYVCLLSKGKDVDHSHCGGVTCVIDPKLEK